MASNVNPRRVNSARHVAAANRNRFHSRRSSTNEHIDDILENARERADNVGGSSSATASADVDTSPIPRQSSFSSRPSPLDEANETAAMLSSRRSSLNYQGLDGSDTLRPRKKNSIYGRSQPSSLHEEPLRERQAEQRRDGADDSEGTEVLDEPVWWEKALGPFRSIELENKGSVARDHLALERTFLAWLRTSLAFASIGIAVTQLFRLNTSLPDSSHSDLNKHTLRRVGKPLGAAFIGISIMTLLLGYRRFSVGQQWVIKGKFPASRGTVLALVFVTLGIMILSLVVVIVISPGKPKG